MNIRTTLTLIMLALMMNMSGQNPYLELTYTAVDNATNVQLDSIKIMNRTQGCDTVLYSPDTLLLLGSDFGTNEYIESENVLQVFQNYPNPVIDQTTVSIYVPDRNEVRIIITDAIGRVIAKTERILEKGTHSFRYAPGIAGILIFTAQWKGETSSTRMLSTASQTTGASSLEYIGGEPSAFSQKSTKSDNNFTFSFGDTLLYIGYTDNLESGILDIPETHETYTFQFAFNIACPGTPTVTYEGQVYNTIQIFSQCWLKENLNVGTMIEGIDDMEDNGIIEKYCYNNEPDSCIKYGGLYQWWEMMQYTTQQGTQGICPPGWHIPTDDEWKILEGTVDIQYGIGHSEWNNWNLRGFDAGKRLKSTSGWYSGGNGTDNFGFSALPGGFRYYSGGFYGLEEGTDFWSSAEDGSSNACLRGLGYDYGQVSRNYTNKNHGFSVRCLKD